MPRSLRPLESRSPIRDDSDRPPHQQHLCDKCKTLGRNCTEYVPADKDVAEEDEIPDEEDAESVITTNSSEFPDNEDDTRSSSSRITPINSDDDDYRLDDVEEKISKLNILK